MTPDIWTHPRRSAYNGNCVEAMWKKSSHSGWHNDNDNQDCAEAKLATDGHVLMRDSKLGDASPVLNFTPAEWRAFIEGVKDGEFDLLSGT